MGKCLQSYIQYDSNFIFKTYIEKTERKYAKDLTEINVGGKFMAYFYFLILSCIFCSEHVLL